jgi:hypothetical protein
VPPEKNPLSPYSQLSFKVYTFLNILWNFAFLQFVVLLVTLNLVLIFPGILPQGEVFVLDSAEFIEDLYYYGSGPQEIDDSYLKKQWLLEDTTAG